MKQKKSSKSRKLATQGKENDIKLGENNGEVEKLPNNNKMSCTIKEK